MKGRSEFGYQGSGWPRGIDLLQANADVRKNSATETAHVFQDVPAPKSSGMAAMRARIALPGGEGPVQVSNLALQ